MENRFKVPASVGNGSSPGLQRALLQSNGDSLGLKPNTTLGHITGGLPVTSKVESVGDSELPACDVIAVSTKTREIMLERTGSSSSLTGSIISTSNNTINKEANAEYLPPTPMPQPTATATSHQQSPTIPQKSPPSTVKRKGPAKKLQGNERCMVCASLASGYHYGVLSCEGCKGFFRRSMTRDLTYECRVTGDCDMTVSPRNGKRKCQHCRLKKCIALGMREFMRQSRMLKEYQSKVRNAYAQHETAIKDAAKECGVSDEAIGNTMKMEFPHTIPRPEILVATLAKTSQTSVSYTPPSTPTPKSSSPAVSPAVPKLPTPESKPDTPKEPVPIIYLPDNVSIHQHVRPTMDSVEKLQKLGMTYLQCEFPNELAITGITPWSDGNTEEDVKRRCRHFSDLTYVTFNLTVNFCAELPDFNLLETSVKKTLISQALIPSFYIRLSKTYHVTDHTIVFINGLRYGVAQFLDVGHKEFYVQELFGFCRRYNKYMKDPVVSSVCFALLVFNPDNLNGDRFSQSQKDEISDIRAQYLHLLSVYCLNYNKTDPLRYVYILECFTHIPELLLLQARELEQTGRGLADFPFLDKMIRETAQSTSKRSSQVSRRTTGAVKPYLNSVKTNSNLPIKRQHFEDLGAPLDTKDL